MNSRFFFALAAPLLFACGVGASQGGGGGGDGADTGGDPKCPTDIPTVACLSCGNPVDIECVKGEWQCPAEPPCLPPPIDGGTPCDTLPQPACTGCYGEPVSPTCNGYSWTCPDYTCPIQVDAGDAGCGTLTADLCSSVPPCDGEYYTAVCTGSVWTCALEGECTAVDAGQPFACGDQGCDPATSYCNITTGGPVDPDGGGSTGFACSLLPTGCTSGEATCACIGIIGNGCSCVEQHGDVTLTCELP